MRRAAVLGKFDLASQMVIELSSLAGTMAAEYATRAGEPPAVAQALAEMEMPRSSNAASPASLPGAVLSLADRFDLLTSMYAIGAIPTGTSDPYGVRRSALGIVRVLREFPALAAVTLSEGIRTAAARLAIQGITVEEKMQAQALEFVRHRYELQLLEAGHPHRLVRAVLPSADCPARSDALLKILTEVVDTEAGVALVAAMQRVLRILPADAIAASDDLGPFTEPSEVALAEVVTNLKLAMAGHDGDLAYFLSIASALPPAVDLFFESIQVLSNDPAIRATRLGLLQSIVRTAVPELDWNSL
ncbi:glycine--tRNA ligase beta subunit [mine drainage metagenome]|uniref:glycine--tRNA ligase n=1 Tax=mine drainage metagenome TaxID=410659 RepID=A0A1J5PAK1_9ZZZZ